MSARALCTDAVDLTLPPFTGIARVALGFGSGCSVPTFVRPNSDGVSVLASKAFRSPSRPEGLAIHRNFSGLPTVPASQDWTGPLCVHCLCRPGCRGVIIDTLARFACYRGARQAAARAGTPGSIVWTSPWDGQARTSSDFIGDQRSDADPLEEPAAEPISFHSPRILEVLSKVSISCLKLTCLCQ